MSKVYDEYQRRLAKGHEMITEAGVEDAAIVEAVLGVLAQNTDRVRFVLDLQTIIKKAHEVEHQWCLDDAEKAAPAPALAPAPVAPAAEVCGCKACQYDRAVHPVIVEYATAEEAAELIAAFGEAY